MSIYTKSPRDLTVPIPEPRTSAVSVHECRAARLALNSSACRREILALDQDAFARLRYPKAWRALAWHAVGASEQVDPDGRAFIAECLAVPDFEPPEDEEAAAAEMRGLLAVLTESHLDRLRRAQLAASLAGAWERDAMDEAETLIRELEAMTQGERA